MCSWATRLSSGCALGRCFPWASEFQVWGLGGCSPLSRLSLFFHCFVSMTGACLSSTRGLMAGLPGFACYGSSLHLGAGCQYWKLLDASVTQLPLCNALIKEGFIVVIVDQAGNFGHESFDRCLLVTSWAYYTAGSFSFLYTIIISFLHYTCNLEQYYSPQCAKKVVSDWPGLVDFSVTLVNFIPYFSLWSYRGRLRAYTRDRLKTGFICTLWREKGFWSSKNDCWANAFTNIPWSSFLLPVKLIVFGNCKG